MTNASPPKDEPEFPPKLKALAQRLAEALHKGRDDQTKDDDDTTLARVIAPGFSVS